MSDADALTAAIDELVSELGPLSAAHANAGMRRKRRRIETFAVKSR
ncbi:MAG: hypothetical protein ACRD0V_14485 [Acidimicrobiales bacterium]